MNDNAKKIIESLNLNAHPEGGFFREIYRSDETLSNKTLPVRYTSQRTFSTSIYYMLVENQISHFHCLKSDETWHYYTGSQVIIHCLEPDGTYNQIKIGCQFENSIFPQFTIKKGTWFAAEIEDKNSYSLIGCTVAPGFEYDDFELGNRNSLFEQFPNHKELITRFTKD
jgi:uncharacterized protein